MNKLLISIPAIAVLTMVVMAASDTSLTERKLRDPKQLRPWLVANATPQTDANSTTTNTVYTPGAVGQMLIGSTGSTSTVWIAKGVTTNDWVKVSN